jgi:DNA-binding MarR family transcriptional regulator
MAIGQEAAVELYGSLSALLRTSRALAQRSREYGAAGTALGVLKTLRDGATRPGDLATGLQVDPSVISRAVVPLEDEGLIERSVDQQDGRATLLGLTDRGRARLSEVQQVYVEQLRQTLGTWSDDEAENAARLLARLEQALGDYRQSDAHGRQLSEVLTSSDTRSNDNTSSNGTTSTEEARA